MNELIDQLLEEFIDLVPRMADDDPVAPALADTVRRAKEIREALAKQDSAQPVANPVSQEFFWFIEFPGPIYFTGSGSLHMWTDDIRKAARYPTREAAFNTYFKMDLNDPYYAGQQQPPPNFKPTQHAFIYTAPASAPVKENEG